MIPDPRNDENLLVAQLHLQFLKLHNHLVQQCAFTGARERYEFARRELTLLYQNVVLHDFLYRVLDPEVWKLVIEDNTSYIWKAHAVERGKIPIEFAAAAMRFGHAMVFDSYTTNRSGQSVSIDEMFLFTGTRGITNAKKLGQEREVDWTLFFSPDESTTGAPNVARNIKPWVWLSRNKPGARPNALPSANLLRGNEMGLPSGQAVARHAIDRYPSLARKAGITVLTPDEINVKRPGQPRRIFDGHQYAEDLKVKTPLWFYFLAEAKAVHKGERLGPLGSLIVAETIRALTLMSPVSVLRSPDWSPLVQPTSDRLTMFDLISAT